MMKHTLNKAVKLMPRQLKPFQTFALLCLAAGVFVLGLKSAKANNGATAVSPVEALEVDRYLGQWFDVRSIPNNFQRGCTNTSAVYAREDHGTLSVINTCDKLDSAGQLVEQERVKGRAWIKNEGNSVLKVSFACFFGFCVESFGGDYWVLGLGPVNSQGLYSWAVVGTPNRQFGWVLSRGRTLDASVWTEIEAVIRAQGYDPAVFQETLHTN